MSRQRSLTILLLSVTLLIITSCRPTPCPTHQVWLDTCSDSLSILHVELLANGHNDSIRLPWPIYRLDTADLTGNGTPEVIVGVVKPTRYWPEPARRLFIYQLIDGYRIRPLWLGSRVGWPLLDFTICRDSFPSRIVTTELNADSFQLRGQYRYQGFGLKFEQYIP